MSASSGWTFRSIVTAPVARTGAGAEEAADGAVAPRRSWRVSLFGCCTQPLSCLAVVCFDCVALGQAWSIAEGGDRSMCRIVAGVAFALMVAGLVLSLIASSATSMAASVVNLVLGALGLVILCFARVMVRRRESIGGSWFTDGLAVVCCAPCARAQLLNQYPSRSGGYRGLFAGYEPLDLDAAAGKAGPETRAPLTMAV
jgi:Cys-rich protein (TIGR01571 family)